jgi:Na+-driven multidrug efflux pump
LDEALNAVFPGLEVISLVASVTPWLALAQFFDGLATAMVGVLLAQGKQVCSLTQEYWIFSNDAILLVYWCPS